MRTTDTRHDETATARPGDPPNSSLDATFEALADEQCRVLLGHLADSEQSVFTVSDLAARLATHLDVDESRLRARLHHAHLPKLHDAGLLTYDDDRYHVCQRPDAEYDAIWTTVEDYSTSARSVSLDDLLDLLADFRRRTAYRTLLSHGDLSLPDLADEVAVAERGVALPEIDPDAVLGVYLSLYHTHVPKLSDEGLVAYDQDGDHVALTGVGRSLEPVVRDLCAVDDA